MCNIYLFMYPKKESTSLEMNYDVATVITVVLLSIFCIEEVLQNTFSFRKFTALYSCIDPQMIVH